MYHIFEDEYIKDYQNPNWVNKIDEKDYDDYKQTLSADPNFNYLYSTTDITIEKVIQSIIPEKGLLLKNPWISSPRKTAPIIW